MEVWIFLFNDLAGFLDDGEVFKAEEVHFNESAVFEVIAFILSGNGFGFGVGIEGNAGV